MQRSPFSLPSALFSIAAVSAFALLAPTACNSDPELGNGSGAKCSTDVDCEEGEFCTTSATCATQCGTCGDPCAATLDCPDGQFCTASKTCQQECDPEGDGEECDSLQACTEDGQCVAENDIIIGGGGGSGDGDGDGDGPNCIDVQVDFSPQIPNVVLLIDQSGTMNAPQVWRNEVEAAIDAETYIPWNCPDTSTDSDNDDDNSSDATWRWNVARNILLNPDTGIVKPLEDRVRFGLALYSSNGGNSGGTCPRLTEVDLAFDNQASMLEAFQCSDIGGDTPTRESLADVAAALEAEDVDGPRVIVLVTDGAPDTCECANWDAEDGPNCDHKNSDNDVEYEGDELHDAGSYSSLRFEQVKVALEAKRIRDDLGITVEVINVGSESLKEHLDKVANFGGAVSGAAIDGTSPGALSDAFQSIIDGVRSCAIDLGGKIATGKEKTGTVLLDEDPTEAVDFSSLKLDDPDGWRVNSPTQIELLGDACETIKSGDHALDISFPCGAFVSTPR